MHVNRGVDEETIFGNGNSICIQSSGMSNESHARVLAVNKTHVPFCNWAIDTGESEIAEQHVEIDKPLTKKLTDRPNLRYTGAVFCRASRALQETRETWVTSLYL